MKFSILQTDDNIWDKIENFIRDILVNAWRESSILFNINILLSLSLSLRDIFIIPILFLYAL